jgi:peptidylprolyl isomerase
LAYTHFPGERLRPLGHRSALLWKARPLAAKHGLRKRLCTGKLVGMKKKFILAAIVLSSGAIATEAPPKARTAGEIVKAAPASDWVSVAPSDLLVMQLAPDSAGGARQVVIQLLPPPFSQGWIGNMRKLAAAHWWDGGAVYRVQDNWVAQFGDPDEDTPKAKPLPPGLAVVPESEYVIDGLSSKSRPKLSGDLTMTSDIFRNAAQKNLADLANAKTQITDEALPYELAGNLVRGDAYAPTTGFYLGFPIAASARGIWPTHCYATVGVARNNSPDTGTGAELYAVIGTPPRQLDRNIAVVGRVIEGIEHLSSLPRAPGNGMYNDKAKNTPILWVRLASELPPSEQPRLQYLSTQSASFRDYVHARVHRRDAFYIYAAGSADICNIPVPIRRAP